MCGWGWESDGVCMGVGVGEGMVGAHACVNLTHSYSYDVHV